MSVTVCNGLDFSLVTNNDDMVQIIVFKKSTKLPARLQSGKWELFPRGAKPQTVPPILIKEGAEAFIVDVTVDGVVYPDGGLQFFIEKEDSDDLDQGYYPHEATIITTDGRVHTVTMPDAELTNGKIFFRKQYTPPPSS